jgi:hypothetical protein
MDDRERRAGKQPKDEHPVGEGGPDHPDPSDYGDPRAAQPGEDPPGEDAMKPPDEVVPPTS